MADQLNKDELNVYDFIRRAIKIRFSKLDLVGQYVGEMFHDQYDGKINATTIQWSIDKHLNTFIDQLNPNLFAVIEMPYVDKVYRDTYYNFYSTKLQPYYRDCCKVSFFNRKVSEADFFNPKRSNKLQADGAYMGFVVLRPTFPHIIGRCALSPKAKKEGGSEMAICAADIPSTVHSAKFSVKAFTHSSQDNQMLKCAETTIGSLLEYFGNKYPEYKPVLPSQINAVLKRFSFKRQIPSDGLTAEQISFALREFGFGTMIYSTTDREGKRMKNFEQVLSSYVESGIPIVATMKSELIGHAVNLIGRCKDDYYNQVKKSIEDTKAGKKVKSLFYKDENISIYDFHSLKHQYVFMDDNLPPYKISGAYKGEFYAQEKWDGVKIDNIIVPLYHKIYLDAARARENFKSVLQTEPFALKKKGNYVFRTFLASSRSYKKHIAHSQLLNVEYKRVITTMPMPKFIWVSEVSSLSNFNKHICDGVLLQDPTEPVENLDGENPPIIGAITNNTYIARVFGKLEIIPIFAVPFSMESYEQNLT